MILWMQVTFKICSDENFVTDDKLGGHKDALRGVLVHAIHE